MPNCPNCEEFVKANWTHCPACGANLKQRRYSQDDDPQARLNDRVDRIDQFLTDKFPEDLENAPTDDENDDNEPPARPRKKAAAKKKRRTLFG